MPKAPTTTSLEKFRLERNGRWRDVTVGASVHVRVDGPTPGVIEHWPARVERIIALRSTKEVKQVSLLPYLCGEALVSWREKQAEEKEEDSIPTGRYELELSHVSYAYTESPDVIEDTMGPDLVHFDDSLECPVRVEGETWYTCNREPSCCCQHWYDPAEDRQRYCQQCSKWWKLGCIRPSDANEVDYEVAESEDDESDEDDDEMLSLDDPEQVQTILAEFSPSKWYPIVRGFHGRYDKRNSWLISGSGNQVKMLREWAVARKPPADWANILGRGFLKDFSTNKTWLSYRCPGCRAKI